MLIIIYPSRSQEEKRSASFDSTSPRLPKLGSTWPKKTQKWNSKPYLHHRFSSMISWYFTIFPTIDIWMLPKIVGFPPKSSILIGVFHYFHHPFWGNPIFGNTHIDLQYSKIDLKKKNVLACSSMAAIPSNIHWAKVLRYRHSRRHSPHPPVGQNPREWPLLVDTLNKKNWLLERSCIIMILPYTYTYVFLTKNHTLNSKLDISDISCRYFAARISKGS